ncbi:MAG: hemerythrin domain-containing protein [Bacteroidia bacterium]|jgi:regulator of cell morphogenesis and NO signaling|nr:hemerythrin domain-containing protein [Bacteroidia bacterium]
MLDKNISELLESNHAYATVMHWHGIDAFSYLNYTLDEVCKLKNINIKLIELELTELSYRPKTVLEKLKRYAPSDLCNFLLKHHHNYAQRILPVIEHHIEQTRVALHDSYPQLHLLSHIFEEFKGDFLRHIAYENEKVFPYIKLLEKHTVSFHHSWLIKAKDFSIEDFIIKHHHDDDEMHHIKKLLNHYRFDERDALPYKVLMLELKSFENELKEHSLIEEEILIPTAIRMEKKIRARLASLTKTN